MSRRIIAALVLVLAFTAMVPSHAAACLCGGRSDDPALPGDLAFVGVVASKDEPSLLTNPGGEWYGIRYTFAVEEVLKGTAGPFVDITSGMGGGDCGLVMAVGERWRIFAYGSPGGAYGVNICGPNALMATGVPVTAVPGRPDPVLLVGAGAAGVLGFLIVRRRRRRRREELPTA